MQLPFLRVPHLLRQRQCGARFALLELRADDSFAGPACGGDDDAAGAKEEPGGTGDGSGGILADAVPFSGWVGGRRGSGLLRMAEIDAPGVFELRNGS